MRFKEYKTIFYLILIRPAALSHIPQIMDIINQVVPIMQAAGNHQWDSAYPNAGVFEKDIALNQLWVVETENQIAGVAAITTDQEPEYAELGWDMSQTAIVTHRLAVSPNFRSMGIAARLLTQADIVAAEMGIDILRIDTNTKNQATQKLFPKMGYCYAGEISLGFRADLRFYCYEKNLAINI